MKKLQNDKLVAVSTPVDTIRPEVIIEQPKDVGELSTNKANNKTPPRSFSLKYARHVSQYNLRRLLLKKLNFLNVTFITLIWLTSVSGDFAGFSNQYSCVKNPCLHGVCLDHMNSSYSCFCEDGFTGYECQTNWNECWSQPCYHGATCIDLIAAFECQCLPGFTGHLCESEINECLSNPCRNNGTCEDFVDKYECTCPLGYTGANCEVDVSVCNSSKDLQPTCQNNGQCIEGPGLQFECNCTSGWRGKLCEDDYNECLEAPCYNGGICVNHPPGGFGCACQHGYTGRLCEEEIIQCKTNPCKNGAFCVMENETATCYCVPDFHGHLCQDRYNDCLPYAPRCSNGGTCIDGVDSYFCKCPPQTRGVLCHCRFTDGEETCETLPHWYEEKEFHPIKPTEADTPEIVPTNVSDSARNVTDYDTYIFSSYLPLESLFPESVLPTQKEYETWTWEYDRSSMVFGDSVVFTSAKLESSLLYTDVSVFPTIESSFQLEITPVLPIEKSTIEFPYYTEETPTLDVSLSMDLGITLDSSIIVSTTPMTDTIIYTTPPSISPAYDLETRSTPMFLEATPVVALPSDAPTTSSVFPSLPETLPTDILFDNATTITPEIEMTTSVLETTQNVSVTELDEITYEFQPQPEVTTEITIFDETSTEFMYPDVGPSTFMKPEEVPITVASVETTTMRDYVNMTFLSTSDTVYNITSAQPTSEISFTDLDFTTEIVNKTTEVVPYDTNITYFDAAFTFSTPWDLNYSVSTAKDIFFSEAETEETASTTMGFHDISMIPYNVTVSEEDTTISSIINITEFTSELDEQIFTTYDNYSATYSVTPEVYTEPSTFGVELDTYTVTDLLETTDVSTTDYLSVTTEKYNGSLTESDLMNTTSLGVSTEIYVPFGISTKVTTTSTDATKSWESSPKTNETIFPTSDIPFLVNESVTTESFQFTSRFDYTTELYDTKFVTEPIEWTTALSTDAFSVFDYNATLYFTMPSESSTLLVTNESITETELSVLTTDSEMVTDMQVTSLHDENVTRESYLPTTSSILPLTTVVQETTDDYMITSVATSEFQPTTVILDTEFITPYTVTESVPTEDVTDETTVPSISTTTLSTTEIVINETTPEEAATELETTAATRAWNWTFLPDVHAEASTKVETEKFYTPSTTKMVKDYETTFPFISTTEEIAYTTTTYEEKHVSVTIPVTDVTSIPDTSVTYFSTDNTTSIDRCLVVSCFNGGKCLVLVPGNEVCQCRFNYTGAFCETYQYVTRPYFSGISYLKLDVGELSLRRGVKMYIQFTSESPNGLLTYAEGNSESFFMLLLRNSLLQFVFSCGLQTVSFLQGNEKLSSNSQTDVSVRLWWTPYSLFMPWGRGRCHASLQLNDSAPVYSEQEAASAEVVLGNLFLGGLSDAYNSPLVVKAGLLPRLRGCVALVEINDLEVDPWLSAVEGAGVKECGKALCPPNACLNGGTCIPGPAQWSCSCVKGFEGDLCERTTCLNNPCFKGICLQSSEHSSMDNPFCLCPAELNGPQCKKQLTDEIGTRLMYTGSYDGYSSYSSHSVKFEHRLSFVIRFHFTTRYNNQLGLMFFLGQRVNSAKKDFIALALVRGYLMLTWDLGAGVRRILSPQPIDVTWHTHSVRVGRYNKLGWLEVDTQGNETGIAPGYLSSLETNKILYLGGHPTWNFTHLPRDLSKLHGFKGCIFDVRVAKGLDGPWMVPPLLSSSGVGQCEIDLCKGHACQNGAACQPVGAAYRCICNLGWTGHFCSIPSHTCEGQRQISCSVGSSCIVGRNHEPPKCLCPFGRAGLLCEKNVTITDPLFTRDQSYISIAGGILLRGYTEISLEFKPLSTDGVLILAVPTTPQGDFLSLTLRNGTLVFTFRLGSSASIVEVASHSYVEIGKWQFVRLVRRRNEGTLVFGNDVRISSSSNMLLMNSRGEPEKSTRATDLLDVQPELFLGGIPDPILLPREMMHLRNASNFWGCIRNVAINKQKFNLDSTGRFGVLRGQGIEDCDGTPCGSEVCNNGGICSYNETTHSCKCSCSSSFVGQQCETPSVCVHHKCENGGTCEPIYFKRRKRDLLDSPYDSLNKVFNNYYCLCLPGYSGNYCEKEDIIHSAQFRNRSYAIVTQGPFLGIQDLNRDSISLNFTSLDPHSLILWKGHMNEPENDYFGLGIYRARLKFIWHLGGEVVGEISPKQFICDGKWHSVSIARDNKAVTLFMDGVAYKSTIEGEYAQLNAPNTIYIGGFPDNDYLQHATYLYFQKSNFVGCLRDVRLHAGSAPVIFSSLEKGRDLQQCNRPYR